MPRLTRLPKYRLHRPSGQAVVTLDGRDFYLGPHGSKASKNEYDRLTGEWLASGRRVPKGSSDLVITELAAAYLKFAARHYRKNDEPTREIENIKSALRPLLALYGRTKAADFGPLSLKALQLRMIELDWARTFVNQSTCRIRRMFRWAVSEELVASSVLHGLQAVNGLQAGRTEARESKPVAPVADATVTATLPHLPPVVCDMVQLQRLLGCRPEEIRILRPANLDRSEAVWVYRPSSHKTEHRGRERTIFVGPRAQEILLPYLLCASDAFCFQPVESERRRKADLRAKRKTPVQPSQVDRSKRRPKRQPGDCYAREDYARAVRRACDKAFPAPEKLDGAQLAAWRAARRWAPNQLRHAAATEIRRQFGLDAAQVILGHSRADVTQVYAERDQSLAMSVVAKIG